MTNNSIYMNINNFTRFYFILIRCPCNNLFCNCCTHLNIPLPFYKS